MKAEIAVDNIKCGGCAATIKRELKDIEGVDTIHVDIENSLVTVDYYGLPVTEIVKKKLAALGYPVKRSQHGLDKATSKVKSYVSCAVGNFS